MKLGLASQRAYSAPPVVPTVHPGAVPAISKPDMQLVIGGKDERKHLLKALFAHRQARVLHQNAEFGY